MPTATTKRMSDGEFAEAEILVSEYVDKSIPMWYTFLLYNIVEHFKIDIMIESINVEAILRVAELSVMRADEHENCSEMLKRANQFIESPDAKKAIIFLGALLALDGEKNLPTQAEGQIFYVKVMTPELQ